MCLLARISNCIHGFLNKKHSDLKSKVEWMVFPAATQDDSTHFLIFVLWVNMMDFCLCFQVNGGIKSEVEVLSANQHNLRSYISPMRLSLFIPSGFHCPQPKEVCSLAAPRAAST